VERWEASLEIFQEVSLGTYPPKSSIFPPIILDDFLKEIPDYG
jgi:hypothetical protein